MQRDQRAGTLHVLASPSLCGNERVTHQEATTCLQLVKHAAVSACSLSAAYPTGRPRSPCPGRGANVEPTRQRRARDHHCRCGLETADRQIGGCRPLAQREFLPCVTCDYQTRYSYSYRPPLRKPGFWACRSFLTRFWLIYIVKTHFSGRCAADSQLS